MSPHWPRGRRAARRAERRRRVVVAAVVGAALLLGGGLTAAAVLGGDDGPAGEEAAATAVRTPTPTVSTVSVVGTSGSTLPAGPCRSGLTPAEPLRLWIAGDSIAASVGTGLGKRAAATGVVAPVYESRVSSGLASPGFFDWPRRVAEEVPRLDPEVVVFVMGTNDWALPQAGPLDAAGQPAWRAAYAEKVRRMVDALTADGRALYWVGPPVLRDTRQEAGAREVASVIREVVERTPDAVYVDAHALFDADDGSYTATADVDGRRVAVRTADGVHLTPEGADYLGRALFDALDARCRLRAQAVAGARQPLVETRGSTSVAPGSTATAPPIATSPPTAAAPAPASPAPDSTTSTTAGSTTTTTVTAPESTTSTTTG